MTCNTPVIAVAQANALFHRLDMNIRSPSAMRFKMID